MRREPSRLQIKKSIEYIERSYRRPFRERLSRIQKAAFDLPYSCYRPGYPQILHQRLPKCLLSSLVIPILVEKEERATASDLETTGEQIPGRGLSADPLTTDSRTPDAGPH